MLFGSCIFQAGEPPSRADPAMKVVIDQSDMFTHVFSALEDNKVIVHSSELYILAQLIVINFSHGKIIFDQVVMLFVCVCLAYRQFFYICMRQYKTQRIFTMVHI